jgi:hypothetical protein
MSYKTSTSVVANHHLNVYGHSLWLFFWLLIYVKRSSGAIILNIQTLAKETEMSQKEASHAIRSLEAWGYIDTQAIGPYIRIQIVRWGNLDLNKTPETTKPAIRREGIEQSDEFFVGSPQRGVHRTLSAILSHLIEYFRQNELFPEKDAIAA